MISFKMKSNLNYIKFSSKCSSDVLNVMVFSLISKLSVSVTVRMRLESLKKNYWTKSIFRAYTFITSWFINMAGITLDFCS